MAPNQSKLTIHPWLDAPLYNRIRYPQWKIYLYNAAQKMCTSLDLTGAYNLVARQEDWDAHPKNFTPYRPPSPGGLHPAVTRPRPTFTMPAFFSRNSTTFERAQWKFDKECFEKYDEAETILHTSYSRAHKEAASPADTSPIGNICIEPERAGGRARPYLKAWGTYSR
jgi:hypothetical protein